MRPAGSRPAKVLVLSFLLTIAVFAAAELATRLAGVEPQEWPTADLTFLLPQIKVDPLLGPLPKPGWSGPWYGKFEVEIDERGFRASGAPPASDAERLVVFMGDSCTFGWGVPTPETFVAQLASIEEKAGEKKFAFLNAAYPGHSASVGVYMLRERVLPLHPDVVVLGYSANNAFRFSLTSDAERFRFFGLRKLLLRSRLFHVLAAKLANRSDSEKVHPRNREAVTSVPLQEVERVAAIGEFEAAMRSMVAEARAAGTEVVFLAFPRASGVSNQFGYEDAALNVRILRKRGRDDESLSHNIGLLEVSCLDHLEHENPMQFLLDRAGEWQPVYPPNPDTRRMLKEGAAAYVAGDLEEAIAIFEKAVAIAPRSPLAHYDLGVTRVAAGEQEAGIAELDKANSLACNVFLQYQVSTWKIAADLDVPVVDLTLYFQSHEELFLDPAHPNAAGHRIIAEAMWDELHR